MPSWGQGKVGHSKPCSASSADATVEKLKSPVTPWQDRSCLWCENKESQKKHKKKKKGQETSSCPLNKYYIKRLPWIRSLLKKYFFSPILYSKMSSTHRNILRVKKKTHKWLGNEKLLGESSSSNHLIKNPFVVPNQLPEIKTKALEIRLCIQIRRIYPKKKVKEDVYPPIKKKESSLTGEWSKQQQGRWCSKTETREKLMRRTNTPFLAFMANKTNGPIIIYVSPLQACP